MAAQTITAPRTRKPRPKTKSDTVRELIAAGCHGVTTIARAADCNHALVSRILATYNIEQNQVDEYRKHRADILAGLQHKILSSLTEGDIKDASALQRVTAAGILYDKERLETGKTTANIGTLIARIQDIQREEADQ
jgi:hypothetical protein